METIHSTGNTNIKILSLSGKFDITQIKSFESSFKELIVPNTTDIGLDLGRLTYIDSSGIGSIIRCMNIAVKEGVNFFCYNLNEPITRVFHLARLEQTIKILTKAEYEKKYKLES